MPVLPNYSIFGGVHPECAALAHSLAYQGVVAPHTGKPYTEAMILGIGGGLGAGYILWEFTEHRFEHKIKVLVLGFRKDWQYGVRYMQTAAERVGVKVSVLETGGAKGASKQLVDALERGFPAITWVDRAHMPYFQLRAGEEGHATHVLLVFGVDGDHVLVDDLALKPLDVPLSRFADGRARIGSVKNRLMLLHAESPASVDLPSIVRAGIHDCIDHLSAKSDSFSLPAIRKWGRMMTDTKNEKGWKRLFEDGSWLYGVLRSVFEGIELLGTGGGGLRGLYADFLTEAAPVLNTPSLNDAAQAYRALAAQWRDLAEAALPDSVDALRETKTLLRQRDHLLMTQGQDGVSAMQPLTDRLDALFVEHRRVFPMRDGEIDDLFATLQTKLLALYDAEVSAVGLLREIMGKDGT